MTIQESVAEKISQSGEKVKNTVIDSLAHAEINKRVDIISKGISKLEALEKELKKIDKNDLPATYDGGVKKEGGMSEKRYQEIQKTKQQIENLKKLIDTALEKNDTDSYNKLASASGGNKEQGKSEDKSEARGDNSGGISGNDKQA